MASSIHRATRAHTSLLCAGLVLSLCIGINAFTQQTRGAAVAEQLYLLTGTPNSDDGYPATLYRVEAGKLKLVRELVPQSEGVRSVQAWGGTIFLVHPAQVPHAVTILHVNEPLRVDDVVFSADPGYLYIANLYQGLAEPRRSVVDALLPSCDPKITLFNISSDLNAPGPRVKLDTWDEYAALRREGEPGGPREDRFAGEILGNNLVLGPLFGHPTVIDSLPPFVREAAVKGRTNQRLYIIAANEKYLLLAVPYAVAGASSGNVDIFIHDRARDRWKTIQIEGNRSRSRLFGSWLATIVEMFNPENKPSPGMENQRNFTVPDDRTGTARLPNVRGAYPDWLPGVLVLQNIEDGRKIRIETGQGDSEVLWIGGTRSDTVLYRVNDTIFQAKIAGSQIQNPRVVVKDEDVPEIHWVFWAN